MGTFRVIFQARAIRLPPLRQERRVGDIAFRIEAAQEPTVGCSTTVSHAANGNVLALTVTVAAGDSLRVESKSLEVVSVRRAGSVASAGAGRSVAIA